MLKEIQETQYMKDKFLDHQALHRNEVTQSVEGHYDHHVQQSISKSNVSGSITQRDGFVGISVASSNENSRNKLKSAND